MKKKSLRLERLSLQKTTIVHLDNKVATAIKGGRTALACCEMPISNADGALSCIGHTCESWVTEDPSCRNCAEM